MEKIKKSTKDANKIFAIKVQYLKNPFELQDTPYRELRMLMQLRKLTEEHKSNNFVFRKCCSSCLPKKLIVEDWSKCTLPLMFTNTIVKNQANDSDIQLLCGVLEYADMVIKFSGTN